MGSYLLARENIVVNGGSRRGTNGVAISTTRTVDHVNIKAAAAEAAASCYCRAKVDANKSI
jgi:hypothetical protein